jgi:hypothetical protein
MAVVYSPGAEFVIVIFERVIFVAESAIPALFGLVDRFIKVVFLFAPCKVIGFLIENELLYIPGVRMIVASVGAALMMD